MTALLDRTTYLDDEVAWLDETAIALREGRIDEIDPETLAEYLSDMARRDRREVISRLKLLMIHLLKWEFQPEKRTKSWELTILEQQDELAMEFDSQTLRRHAENEFDRTYASAVKYASAETNMPMTAFPSESPWTLNEVIGQ